MSLFLRRIHGTVRRISRLSLSRVGQIVYALRRTLWDDPLAPRRTRRFILGAISLLVLIVAWPTLGHWIFFTWPNTFDSEYDKWHQARARPVVQDADGRLIGLYPTFRIERNAKDNASQVRQRSYLAAQSTAVPQRWWQLLTALEDGNAGLFYHYRGIDYSQFLAVPYRFVTSGVVTGGSTRTMQVIKSMQMETDERTISRKARDLLHAPPLNVHIEHSDNDSLKRWYARHVNFTQGNNERGLTTASYAIFREELEDLSLAQQALLAAAPLYQLDLEHTRNWTAARNRALHGLRILKSKDQISETEFQKAQTKLNELERPSRAPSAGIKKCLARRSNRAKEYAVESLAQRSKKLAHGELIQARSELKRLVGEGWWKKTTRIRLNVDLELNCTLKWNVESLLSGEENPLPAGAEDPRITIAISDSHGHIVGFYSSLFLPRYMLDRQSIGSTGKVLAALAAAADGDEPSFAAPDERGYFNKRRKKTVGPYPFRDTTYFTNPGGEKGYSDTESDEGWVTPKNAFAHSQTLAIMWRLSLVDTSELESLVNAFGFENKSYTTRAVLRESDPYYIDIPLGDLAGASARKVHRMMQAVGAGVDSGVKTLGCTPHIVNAIKLKGQDEWTSVSALHSEPKRKSERRPCEKAKALLDTDPKREFVKSVLGGVVDPESGGTAASVLGDWRGGACPFDGGSGDSRLCVNWHIAKTGTVAGERQKQDRGERATSLAWTTGALKTGGEFFSYVALIAPNERKSSLPANTYGHHAGRLVEKALRSYIESRIGD